MTSYLRLANVPEKFQEIGNEPVDESLPSLEDGRWIFFFGPAGCGKTHRAVQMLHAHLTRTGRPEPTAWRPWHHAPRPKPGASFVDWSLFLDEKRRFFSDPDEDAEDPSERVVKNDKLVVLDDVGSERTTDFAIDSFNVAISARYNEFRPTIITSNLTLDDVARVYGNRIASRIREVAMVVDQSGTDWRIRKGMR